MSVHTPSITAKAEFSQSRNDLYWSLYDMEDGFIRWSGYDDANWWNNVSVKPGHNNRVGKMSGRTYELDYASGQVIITPAEQSA